MEIIHTTYEQAHVGGRTTSAPSQPRPQAERKHEEKKKSQKPNDRNSDPSSSRSQQKIPRKAVPVKESDIRLRDEKGKLSYPVPTPDLRRKGGFYDVPRKEEKGKGKERESQEGTRQKSSINFSSATSSPFHAHRLGYQASQTREIPRSTPQQPPPRPINTNTVSLSPRNEYKSKSMEIPVTPWPTVFKQTHPQHKHQKSKSTSNKFVEYIRNSADLFDDARREMTGKLSPAIGPLDPLPIPNHMNFSMSVGSGSGTESGPSSTRGSQRGSKTKTKSKRNSADSIASFYCAGDSHLEDKENKPPITKDTLQLPNKDTRKPRYFSPSPGTVEKLTSSTDVEPRLCRLCNKYPEGIMGLCRQCEEDFTRPNSWTPPEPAQEASLDTRIEGKNPTPPPKDEIKPTPPLKIFKTSSIGPLSPTSTQSPSTMSTSPSPILHSPPGPKLGSVTGGKTVINPATLPGRQNSHHVIIVDADEEEDARYSRYQSEAMRTDAERTREDLKNWARGYGSEMDHHPQKARRRWGDGVERNTNFYGFYDDILDR